MWQYVGQHATFAPNIYKQYQSKNTKRKRISKAKKRRQELKNESRKIKLEALPNPDLGRDGDYMELGMAGQEKNEVEEVGEEEVDDMEIADTYANYMPAKLKIGSKHPDPVVETASLSSVAPPDVWFSLVLTDMIVDTCALSALQLEAVTYASQQHEHFLPDGSRCGYLIGDGAGVGKGRTIAACIYENFLNGRKKAIWVSVSTDLKYDSERDLRDIGADNLEVYHLNKIKYTKQLSHNNKPIKEGVIFSTYSSLISKTSADNNKMSRMDQLLDWCGPDFDGIIAFDECHRAKNLCPSKGKPTKTGMAVLALQQMLPKARVVYASATGATVPLNMAYMTRLGLWGQGTPFPKFEHFNSAVEKRGVGAMEIVAMDMKLRGMYIARQLSFEGVEFKIIEVPLTPDLIKVYDEAVIWWVEAIDSFEKASGLVGLSPKKHRIMMRQFWSAHQRFFKYLCISAKVSKAVQVARAAVKCGKCAVIGLQSTGEARTLGQLEAEDGVLSEFVSSAKGVLENLVQKQFPAPDNIDDACIVNLNRNQNLSSMAGKRKPVRQAASKATKKLKKYSPDSDSDEDDDSKHSDSDDDHKDSDFVLSFASEETDDNDDGNDNKEKRAAPIKKTEKNSSNLSFSYQTNNFCSPMNFDGSTTEDMSSDSDSDKKDIKDVNKFELLTKNRKKPLQPLNSNLNTLRKNPNKEVSDLKNDLLKKIAALGKNLPQNTLDQLINELGGPENVAEMTGRKGRVVQDEGGSIQYESRSEVGVSMEALNLKEKERFMNGEKLIAIISEAASSGISLQSDRRVRNQRKRVHITLELPWSADRAIQQFGRTHRSNQVNSPEYVFLISDLAGERRFASIVARRLECLGALTHGDRRATETRDLSHLNFNNKYGQMAIKATMNSIMGFERPIVPIPKNCMQNFYEEIKQALDGVGLLHCFSLSRKKGFDYCSVSRFFNRILGVPVELQNLLFQYFLDTHQEVIKIEKKNGKYDAGILDLGTAGDNVKRVKKYSFLRKHATGLTTVEINILHVERGLSWKEAMSRWSELTGEGEGFYLTHQVKNGKRTAILAVCKNSHQEVSEENQLFTIYRPNTGLQNSHETFQDLTRIYYKVPYYEAEKVWTEQYESSETVCSHAYWSGICKNKALGLQCMFGMRKRVYNILSGSVLSVWSRLESVMMERKPNMQVVRLSTSEGTKIVGTIIPQRCVERLRLNLETDSESADVQIF